MRRALPLLVVILFAGCVPSSAAPEREPMVASVSRPGVAVAQQPHLEDVLHQLGRWFAGVHQIAVRRPAASPAVVPGRRTAFSPDASAWDRIAACESGGNWAENTGNSYFGGLQEDMTFWRSYGGLDFAERPDLASREQQITVAERARDSGRGYSPWPVCGRRA